MSFSAATYESTSSDSRAAGLAAGSALRRQLGARAPRVVVVYASVQHDQEVLLRAMREGLGAEVPVIGCSVQGIMVDGRTNEGGFLLGAMALAGEGLAVGVARVDDVDHATASKGAWLAEALQRQLGQAPQVTLLWYDPLCGADVEELLAGARGVMDSPVIGGGASQPWGPMIKTYQYWGSEVISRGAVALGLAGGFGSEIGVCHGTTPTGVEMTLTRSEGNRILEIDGRPALDVWREITGAQEHEINDQNATSSWAVGVQRGDEQHPVYVIRGSFGFDVQAGAVIVQAAIPEGTRIMFHHRTVAVVTQGTELMARQLQERLGTRTPWAVLGFECGARTGPFLGERAAMEENQRLRAVVAPDAPCLGMMAWGEVAPVGGVPGFHNYTYPLLVLSSEAQATASLL